MISNERPSPYGASKYGQPRPHVPEDILKSAEIQIERKTFVLTLKENQRGRFLCITEKGAGSRAPAIIIPATGLLDFLKILADMVMAENEIPKKQEAASDSEDVEN